MTSSSFLAHSRHVTHAYACCRHPTTPWHSPFHPSTPARVTLHPGVRATLTPPTMGGGSELSSLQRRRWPQTAAAWSGQVLSMHSTLIAIPPWLQAHSPVPAPRHGWHLWCRSCWRAAGDVPAWAAPGQAILSGLVHAAQRIHIPAPTLRALGCSGLNCMPFGSTAHASCTPAWRLACDCS